MRWQYQGLAEPASTSPETVTVDKYQPTFPDFIRRAPALIAAIIAGSYFAPVIIQDSKQNTWESTYPSRIAGSARVQPVENPNIYDYSGTLDKWEPTYPSRIAARSRVQPTDAAFVYNPPPSNEVITLDKWEPHAPDRLNPAKRALVLYPAEVLTTKSETIYGDKWAPTFPDYFRRPYRQQPDSTVVAPTQNLTLDRWQPTYPDRIDGRRRVTHSGNTLVDLEKVTIDRYQPTYPSWFPARKRVPSEVALFFQPLIEAITIDKWEPRYPVRIDRKSRIFWDGWSVKDPVVPGVQPFIYNPCRVYYAQADNRLLAANDMRTYTVQADNRLDIVKCCK